MLFLSISQLGINLIRKNKQIVFYYNFCNLLQLAAVHHRSGGVVGEGKNQKLCLRRNLFQKLFRRQTELILFLQLNRNRNTSGQNSTGHIGNIAGLRNQNLVSRIQHGPHGNINALAAAYRYYNLLVRIIADMTASLQIIVNLHSEIPQTCIGCIKGSSFFQRIDAFLPDMPGRIKIRFSDT